MGKVLFSLAFATALLGVASSEASAAGSFVCQAVGPRSVGYGRAYFVADAKWQALIRCERYSGICIISYRAFRRPDYWLKPRRKSLRTPRTTREARHEGIHKSGKVRIAISAPARRC